MRNRLLSFLFLIIASPFLIFSGHLDSIETTDTYKNLGTLYFKKSTTLSVLAHIDGSHWEVYLNEHRETNYHGKTIHNSSTVTKTGTYYARLKEYNGFTKKWRKKDSKSIKVVKDSTAPVLSYTNGNWSSRQVTVIISSSDSQSGVATTEHRYNSKGTWLSGSSGTIYSGRHIQFKVVDNVDNIAYKTVTISDIDKIKPSVRILTSPDTWTNGNVTVTGIPKDYESGISATYYKVDSGKWIKGTSKTITKNSKVFFYTVDKAGNKSDEFSYNIDYIDKIDPKITIDPIDTSWTNKSIKVTATATDAMSGILSTEYSTDLKKTWHTGSSFTAENNLSLYFRTTDKADNVSSIFEIVVDNIDKRKPIVDNLEVSPSGWVNGNVTVTAKVSDSDSGIDFTEYRKGLDGKWVKGISTEVVNNNTIVYCRTTDRAGNVSKVIKKIRVDNIDKVDPSITGITLNPKTWTSGTVTVTPEPYDADSGIKKTEYCIDGNKKWIEGTSVEISKNSKVKFRTTDNVGRSFEEKEKVVSNIDKKSPTIKIDFKPDYDPLKWYYSLDLDVKGTDNESGLKSLTYSIDSGTHWDLWTGATIEENGTLVFRATDNVGHSTDKKLIIKNIDHTPPKFEILESTKEITNSAVTISLINIVEGQSGISKREYLLGEGSNWIEGDSVSVSKNCTVKFRLTDVVGNSTEKFVTIGNIDNDPPEIGSKPFFNGINIINSILKLLNQDEYITDNRGIKDIKFSFNNLDWYNYKSDIKISDYPEVLEGDSVIWIRAIDFGGSETKRKFNFIYDVTKPVISYRHGFNNSSGEYGDLRANSSIQIENLNIEDIYGYDANSKKFCIEKIGGDTVQAYPINGNINLGSYTEGDYRLIITAIDNAGNISDPTDISFSIDRTPPATSSLNILLHEDRRDIYLSEDRSTSNQFLNLIVEDLEEIIEPLRLKYIVSKLNPSLISQGEVINQITSNAYLFNGDRIEVPKASGVYYLYILIYDQAGNRADNYLVRRVRVDNSVVAIPRVSGIKYAWSLEDVTTYNSPTFIINPGLSQSSTSSVIGYTYNLTVADTSTSIKSGDISSTKLDTELIFDRLMDSREGEKYQLSVKAVGESGKISKERLFLFRIDTKPPLNLRISSKSHKLSKQNYSYDAIKYSWTKPLDMTGIKEYKYYLSNDGEEYTLGDSSNIVKTGYDCSLTINLGDNESIGKKYLRVNAIDYGNLEDVAEYVISYNRSTPKILASNIECNMVNRTAKLLWDTNGDVKFQEVIISKDGEEFISQLSGDIKEKLFTGLDVGKQYGVKIIIYSNSYPSRKDIKSFDFILTSDNSIIEHNFTPFISQFRGFETQGNIYNSPDESIGELITPENLTFKIDDKKLESITLKDLNFDNGNLIWGENPDVPFSTEINSLKIKPISDSGINSGIILDKFSGLTLTNRVIDYPIGDNKSLELEFDQVIIDNSSDLSFGMSYSKEFEPVELKTMVGDKESWILSNITRAALFESGIRFTRGEIQLSTVPGIRFSVDGEDFLAVSNLYIKDNKQFKSGDIITDYNIDFDSGLGIKVLSGDSYITGDYIVIERGELLFGASGSIFFENLVIDRSGQIVNSPDRVTPFSINHGDGVSFGVTSLSFSKDIIFVNGSVFIDGKEVTGSLFFDFNLTKDGIGENSVGDLAIGYDAVTQSGFTLYSPQGEVKITDRGILLKKAYINLDIFRSGLEGIVRNTLLDYSFKTIIESGLSGPSDILELSNPSFYKDDSTFKVNNLELSNSKLIGRDIDITLPKYFSNRPVLLREMELTPTGELKDAEFKAKSQEVVLESGFTGAIINGFYGDNAVHIPELAVKLPLGSTPKSVTQKNFKITHHKIVAEPIDSEISYSKDGFIFNIHTPEITPLGIEGQSDLLFKVGDVQSRVKLEGFILYSTGEYSLDDTTNLTGAINLFGYKGRIRGFQIDGSQVKFLKLYLGDMEIDNLVIDSNGEIVDPGTSSKVATFVSNNGFYSELENISLSSRGLTASGNIYLPDYLNALTPILVDNNRVRITPNWDVLTDIINTPIAVKIDGVTAKISDYNIFTNGLYIGDTQVELSSGDIIPVKGIGITADNRVLSNGHLASRGVEATISGWNMRIISANYSSNGLKFNSLVDLKLPGSNSSINFTDSSLFERDGITDFTTTTTIGNLKIDTEEIGVDLSRVSISSNSLQIEDGVIRLPQGDIFNGESFGVRNFTINSDGSFNFNGSESEPLFINGLEVYVDGLESDTDFISIKGRVKFPNDFGLESLAGSTFSIKELSYNYATKKSTFNIALDHFSLELEDDWNIDVTQIGVNSTGLTIGEGVLSFPETWLDNISVEEMGFSNLSYNFSSHELGIEEIYLDNIQVNCEGYEFTITKASYSSNGISFGGYFPLDGLFQGEVTDPILDVRELRMDRNFNIVKLEAGLDAKSLSFTPNRELLYSGYIGTKIGSSGVVIDLEGVFKIGPTFYMEDMIGDEVSIDNFEYSLLDLKILELNAQLTLTEKSIYDTKIKDFIFGIDYTDGSDPILFTLGGLVVLPNGLPGVGGEIFGVDGQFYSDGSVKRLTSELTIADDRALAGDIILKAGSRIQLEPELEATNDNKQIIVGLVLTLDDVGLELNSSFSIEKLRGSSLNIDSLEMTTKGKFNSCDIELNIVDNFQLFDDVTLNGGSISLGMAETGRDLLFSVKGILQLPEEYGSIGVGLNYFNLSSTGDISIDGVASDISGDFLDNVRLSNGEISLRSGDIKGELKIEVSGDFKLLSEELPPNIRDANYIGEFNYSTVSGIELFRIGLPDNSPLSYGFVDGLDIAISEFKIDNEGFTSVASLTIERRFYGFNGTTKIVGSLKINWLGNIVESDLVLSKLDLIYAGMGLSLENVMFDNSGLKFKSALLHLPDVLGGAVLGLENGGVDKSKKLYGDFVLDKINVELLGCGVELVKPRLNMDKEEITCASSSFILPPALGSGAISVSDVVINSNGLMISGGTFRLPDIDTGALKFSNMSATLIMSNNWYEIGATGKVFIAGMGEVEARLALVPITSPTYPIGLKYAYFGFETQVGGIPIGTTGLVVTGLRGGLAFGPPGIDLPDFARDKFTDGMRVQLGISIADAGHLVVGSSDYWLNLTNLDFALKGELEYLQGLFSSYSTALYTQNYGLEVNAGINVGFYGKIDLNGNIRAHIFEQDNKARLCADAILSVAVRNLLYDFPKSPYRLGSLGVEVGDFTRNRQGFKGYVDLKIIGKKGFYIGSDGTWKLGNVSSFKLLDTSMRSSNSRNFRLISGDGSDSPRSVESNIERIVFNIDFKEGDPVVYAVSPSGQRYMDGDSNIEMVRMDNQILLAVVNPEPGNWTIKVDNLTADSEYHVEAISFGKNSTIAVDEFDGNNGKYRVSGKYRTYTDKITTIRVYGTKEYGKHQGELLLTTNPKGNEFNIDVDASSLETGEYYLYISLDDGVNPEVYEDIGERLSVYNSSDDETAISDLLVGINDDKSIGITFSDIYKGRAKGFTLTSIELITGKVESLDLGYLTKFTLSTLDPEKEYDLYVTPYFIDRRQGVRSNSVTLDFSKNKKKMNEFTLKAEPIELEIGNSTDFNLNINVNEFTKTDSAYDAVEFKILSIPERYIVKEIQTPLYMSKGINSKSLKIFDTSFNTETPDNNSITILVSNIGNSNISKTVTIPIALKYPKAVVNMVTPDSWHIFDKTDVVLSGKNFTKDTKVYIGDVECDVLDVKSSSITIKTPIIPSKNSYVVKAYNPNSEPSNYSIDLIKPYSRLIEYKTSSKTTPGSRAWFYSRVRGFQRYTDVTELKVVSKPDNWIVDLPTSTEVDQLFAVAVTVPENTKAGSYTIDVEVGSNRRTYSVVVEAEFPNPRISSLSKTSGMWGDEVTIFGYGFTTNSTVTLNSLEITPNYVGEDMLKFTVPDRAVDGMLQIKTMGEESNSVKFQIRNNSFNLYPSVKTLNMIKGESYTGSLHVYGYSDYVGLKVSSDSNYVTASLSSDYIVPNGSVDLDIELLGTTPSGTYTVTFEGDSNGVKKDEILTIYVGDNVSLIDKSLKTGKVATRYSDSVEVKNNLYDLRYLLDGENKLPTGLFLNSETGEISGIPETAGRYVFTVKVYDGTKRSNIREYSIIVDDSGWFRENGPSGNNRFTGTSSTAEDRVKWISEKNSGGESLLSSGNTIYSLSNKMLSLINRETGVVDSRLSLEASKLAIESGYILALTGGDFTVNSREDELARFKDIIDFRVLNGSIYLKDSKGKVSRLTTEKLELEDALDSTIFNYNSVVTSDSLLTKDSRTEFITSYGGDVVKLSVSGRYIDGGKSLETGVLSGKIAVGEEFSIVYNSSAFLIINRDNFSFLYRELEIKELILTGDKLFILNSSGLEAINLYSGANIWSSRGNYHSLISAGKDIYILDSSGRIICFGGRVNVEPPESTVVLDPVSPNGTNGYYKTVPTLRVDVVDRESYGVASYRLDPDDEFTNIDEPIEILDGETTFNYRSIDNLGLREDTRTVNIKVDSVPPETTGTVLNHITKKVLKLESSDSGSGLFKIEYKIDGGEYLDYTEEVEFSSGSYLIYYKGVDNAGNVEDEKSLTIELSDSANIITSYVEPKFNLFNNSLILRVVDSNKISSVEYSLDSTGVYTYQKPIKFSPGEHRIYYRGIDKLDKRGSWATYTFSVKGDDSLVKSLKSYTGEIPVLLDVKPKLEAFINSKRFIPNLPSYLTDSQLLQNSLRDGVVNGRYLEFRSNRDINVYIVKVLASTEDYNGFEVVEDDYFLDPEDLFGKVTILKRKYYKGELIEISGANTKSEDMNNLIFIKPNTDRQFTLDVTMDRGEARIFSSSYKNPEWTLIVEGKRESLGSGLRVEIPKIEASRAEVEFRVEINGKEYVDSYPIREDKGGLK